MSCSMSFGEINIPSSRAFWDDCDEDEPAEDIGEKLELKYESGGTDALTAPDMLFLIEGSNIVEFAEKTLLSDAIKIASIPAKNSALYSVRTATAGKNVLLAVLEEDLTSSGEVSELLWQACGQQARQVVTLTIKSKVDYKTESIAKVRDVITFLRGINAQLNHIEALKAPNFIAGTAAGVASSRENEQLPVSSYVAYTDNVSLDALAAQPIIKLLQDLGLTCASSFTPKLKDDSHLYS